MAYRSRFGTMAGLSQDPRGVMRDRGQLPVRQQVAPAVPAPDPNRMKDLMNRQQATEFDRYTGQQPPRDPDAYPPVEESLNQKKYAPNLPMDVYQREWRSSPDPSQNEVQVREAREIVYEQYPTLREYDIRVRDRRRDQTVPNYVKGSLEFMGREESGPPDARRPESDKSTDGFYAGGYHPTIELYERVESEDLPKALFGDMLHHLSDEGETRGVAPEFQKLLGEIDESMTDRQKAFDRERHKEIFPNGEDPDIPQSYFDKWWKYSARDAFVRGYLAPDKRDEMRRQDVYTDKQRSILKRMDTLLKGRKGRLPDLRISGLSTTR